jgi:hypothetical protein
MATEVYPLNALKRLDITNVLYFSSNSPNEVVRCDTIFGTPSNLLNHQSAGMPRQTRLKAMLGRIGAAEQQSSTREGRGFNPI